MVHKELPSAMEADCKAPAGGGMAASVDYLVGSLLEDRHYERVTTLLRGKWDRCQSLHAATKLMEKHGVELSEEEEQQLLAVGEEKMIEVLVSKMPPQSKEQFQEFFLELQAVVATATSVRAGLREGRPDLVEGALEQAEGTGVAQHILKMAIVQAGSEVENLKTAHGNWVKDSQARMSKLLRGQEDKREAQRKLAAARAVLASHQAQHNERAKRVLAGFCSGNTKLLAKTLFFAWASEAGQSKCEDDFEEEHRQRLKRADGMFYQAKVRQLDGVRRIMISKARECDKLLLSECFAMLQKEARESRAQGVTKAEVKRMEERLQSLTSASAQRAKGLMQKLGTSMDSDLLGTCMQVWASEAKELAKEKEYEAQVQEAKAKIDRLQEERKSNARGLLDRIVRDTTTGLLHQCFQAWQQFLEEERQANAMAASLHEANSKLRDFHGMNRSKAENALDRAADHMDMMLVLSIFCNWRLHNRMEDLLRQQMGKMESKKTQLGKVQTMFKGFAQELEANFRQSTMESDTDWHLSPQHRRPRREPGGGRADGGAALPSLRGRGEGGTLSLPSIHARQPLAAPAAEALSRSPKALDSLGAHVEDHRLGEPSRQAWH